MSLVAWFPFDGDTKDYSKNNIPVTTSGITYNPSGKIGKSLEVGSVTIPATYTKKIFNKYCQSICFWYYNKEAVSSTTGNHRITGPDTADGGTRKYTLFAYPNNDDLHLGIRNDNLATNIGSYVINDVLPNLMWTHVCLINDNGVLKTYINSVLKDTTIIDTESWVASFDYDYPLINSSPYHKINDYRIYDHALSEKERLEIYKTKILHYTFDDFQEPTLNFNGDIIKTYIKSASVNVTEEVMFGRKCLKITRPAGVTGFVGIKSVALRTSMSNIANKNYTLTFEYFVPTQLTQYFRMYCGEYDSANLVIDYRHYITAKEATDNIVKVSNSWIANPTASYYSQVSLDFGPEASTADDTIYIFSIQLEEKDHPTPYTNNSRKGIIRDNSGYGNDVVIGLATSPEWTQNSKIGNGAYRFVKDVGIPIDKFQSNVFNEITVSAWIKVDNGVLQYSDFGSYIVHNSPDNSIGSSIYSITMTTDGRLIWSWCGNYANMTSSLKYNDGNWHHVVGVWNGSKSILYIDGNKIKEADITTNISGSAGRMAIGFLPNNITYRCFNGYIDDVRIYATALSYSDVLDLYKNTASIDNKGNLYTHKLSQIVVGSGLVAHWKLNGNTNDSIGNNHLTMYGTAPVIIDGPMNEKCYKLDNGAFISPSTSKILSDEVTISFWCNLDSYTPMASCFIGARGSGGMIDGCMIYCEKASQGLLMIDYGGSSNRLDSGYRVQLGKWYHIVIVISKTARYIYANGILVSKQITDAVPIRAEYPLYIGSISTNQYFVNGAMLDVRIYNRPISSREVSTLYKIGGIL